MNKKPFLVIATFLAIILAINVVSAYSYWTPHNYGFENSHKSYTKTYHKSVNYHSHGYDKTVVISKDYKPNYHNNYGYYGNKYASNYYGKNQNTGYWHTKAPYHPHHYKGRYANDYTKPYYYAPYYNHRKGHYDW